MEVCIPSLIIISANIYKYFTKQPDNEEQNTPTRRDSVVNVIVNISPEHSPNNSRHNSPKRHHRRKSLS
jgi:hypothetical protein